MTKGEPHFPRVRPDDPMVAPEYIKPFGLISKAKWYQRIYKTKDVGAMWRVAAGRQRQAASLERQEKLAVGQLSCPVSGRAGS